MCIRDRYGSSMSNPNEHNHFPLPLLVAGGASDKLQGGRHLKFPERTPMSNLLLGLLEKACLLYTSRCV